MPAVQGPNKIIIYHDAAGNEPFTDWLNGLRDATTRRRILKRLLRLEQGHFGDVKSVGADVKELRFFFGAGYRVYFAEDGDTIVVLLCGGDKDSQSRDIRLAQAYWQEYKEHD
jgi:putative addiction module killer protein